MEVAPPGRGCAPTPTPGAHPCVGECPNLFTFFPPLPPIQSKTSSCIFFSDSPAAPSLFGASATPSGTTAGAHTDEGARAVRALNDEVDAFRVEDTLEGRYRIFRFASNFLATCGARPPSDAARGAFRPEALQLGLAMIAYFVDACGASAPPDVVHEIWIALCQVGKAFRVERGALHVDLAGAWDALVVDLRRRRPASCLQLYRHGVQHVLGDRAATVEEAVRRASSAELEAASMHGALSGHVRSATVDGDALLASMARLVAWHTAVRAHAARRREARVLARRDTNADPGQPHADRRERARSRARGRENAP